MKNLSMKVHRTLHVQQVQIIGSEVKFIVGRRLPWLYVMKEKKVKFSKLLAHRGISPDLCGIVLYSSACYAVCHPSHYAVFKSLIIDFLLIF